MWLVIFQLTNRFDHQVSTLCPSCLCSYFILYFFLY